MRVKAKQNPEAMDKCHTSPERKKKLFQIFHHATFSIFESSTSIGIDLCLV
jgi:hypothetical protein